MDSPLRVRLLPNSQTGLTGRSGHRVVVDGHYLYCWGGYNPEHQEECDPAAPLFQQLWRYNVWSQTWSLLPTHGHVPTELASHSIIEVQNHLLHFGGTGTPFGETNTNRLYDLDLDTLEWRSLVQGDEDEEESNQWPRPKYGQTMTLVGEYIYIIGGTSGFMYDCDVHRLSLQTLTWEELTPTSQYVPEGRYRHQVVHYAGRLYMFGGGIDKAGAPPHDLDTIDVFDIEKRRWCQTETQHYLHPDTGHSEYPAGRKCHSCTRYRHTMYLCGGVSDEILADIWSLHLVSLQWTRLDTRLVKPVYFHGADVSQDGCLFIFGGVTRIADRRTSDLQILWTKIPQLKLLCWKSIVCTIPLQECSRQKHNLLSLGIPRQFLETVL